MSMTNLKAEQRIVLHHCKGYGRRILDPCIEKTVSALLDKENFSGKIVLLKPNLISGRGMPLACTNRHFLAGAARYFLDRGAKVKVGDSPAYGSSENVMAKHGMLPLLEEIGVEIVNFLSPVEFTLENGVRVEIAEEALDCDWFVNLPKLKAHNQMFLTGAVKNFFGTVVGVRKAVMHMRHGRDHREFSDILVRLPGLFPPHITLLDGIEAMHGSGPLDGSLLELHCLAGSRCPVALDTAILSLLELPCESSPLWQAAVEMGMSGSFPESHQYPAECPEDFWGSGFVAPGSLNPIRFNLFRFMLSSLRRFALAFRS